jgi:energy-coupling factor transport system permease protein
MFGNPVTFESVVFGLKSSLSLITILVMFSAFNIIINPEKFIYLFSRVAEQTSFVVMLGLRFIPTLKRRMSEISDIAKVSGLNNPVKKQSIFKIIKLKINESMNIIMTLITWSLEDAVITAQSMRSRGYGVNIKSQNGRTFYFIYKFTKRDLLFILFNATSFVLFLFTFIKYEVDFKIYPTFSSLNFNYLFFINLICLTFQVALPILIEIINRIKWSFIYNADNRI